VPSKLGAGDAVALICDIAARRPDETLWVGVDGRGAAGKSTFAARLADVSARVRVVHVDDFAGPRVQTWDHARFEREVASPLRAGRSARYQRWDWDHDEGAEWHVIAPGSVVVVEGVSATRADVSVPWTVRVWVDAPRDVRLRRALERDGSAMMARWLEDWMPSEESYIARERPERNADLQIDGTDGTDVTADTENRR
jgi:uridine kinase